MKMRSSPAGWAMPSGAVRPDATGSRLTSTALAGARQHRAPHQSSRSDCEGKSTFHVIPPRCKGSCPIPFCYGARSGSDHRRVAARNFLSEYDHLHRGQWGSVDTNAIFALASSLARSMPVVFDPPMQPTLVILVVGLSPALVGEHTPHLKKLASDQGALRPLNTVTPAVTCTAQSTLVTGLMPSGHGAVANGWYFRDLVRSLALATIESSRRWRKNLGGGEEEKPGFHLRQDVLVVQYVLFGGLECDAATDVSGRRSEDPGSLCRAAGVCMTSWTRKLGQFPLFTFWGPVADISSSDWIAKATLHVMATRKPTLTLTYLPHLDYNLQRLGPRSGPSRACKKTSARSTPAAAS